MMNQPDHFGQFLLFHRSDSNSYRSCYRAGLAKGRAIERIVRLDVFDQPDIEPKALLKGLGSSAELRNKLRDPHIANGVGLGQVDGIPYVAYDFELGTTLAALLVAARQQSFPIPLDQAMFVAERVALALAAAYQIEHLDGPVLHSFLTPDSILLSHDGQVKVYGFDVGRALHDQLADRPFCAPYTSPQCRSGQTPLARDDVFSLGSILFELVTGQPLSTESMDLSQLTVQATGEPVPENLRLLLEGSFAPPAIRISHVMEWQQRLGRLILDSEYNPTTFNLSFLLHTLLREPLQRGETSLRQEKRFVLPQESAADLASEATKEVATSAQSVLADGQGLDSTSVSLSDYSEPDSADGKPFWLGFSISGITASALVAAFLVFGGGTKEGPANPLTAPANAAVWSPNRLGSPVEPAESSEQADQANQTEQADQADQTEQTEQAEPGPAGPATSSATEIAQIQDRHSPVVLTDVVNGELGQPLDGQAVQQTGAKRANKIESDLKAEYEQRIESLRRQLIDSQHREMEAARDSTSADGSANHNGGAEALLSAATTLQATTAERELPRSLESEAAPKQTSVETGERRPTEASEALPTPPLGTVEDHPAPAETTRNGAAAVTTAGASNTSGAADTSGESGGAGTPVPVSPADTSAQLLRLIPPSYPGAARRLGLSASARIKVLISAEGKVREAHIVGPPLGGGFDRAAIAAVRRSRWKPATRGGEPVESWSALTLEFKP